MTDEERQALKRQLRFLRERSLLASNGLLPPEQKVIQHPPEQKVIRNYVAVLNVFDEEGCVMKKPFTSVEEAEAEGRKILDQNPDLDALIWSTVPKKNGT